MLWSFAGDTGHLESASGFLIWSAKAFSICMFKYLGGCWFPVLTYGVVKVAQLSKQSLQYTYKAHVGVKGSIWHA